MGRERENSGKRGSRLLSVFCCYTRVHGVILSYVGRKGSFRHIVIEAGKCPPFTGSVESLALLVGH